MVAAKSKILKIMGDGEGELVIVPIFGFCLINFGQ